MQGRICLEEAYDWRKQLLTFPRSLPTGVYRTRNYTYDDVYRLTGEERVQSGQTLWRHAYEYDLAGNRTNKHHYDGTSTASLEHHNNNFNQLYKLGSEPTPHMAVNYDDNGNLQDKQLWGETGPYSVYTHDRENRLAAYSAHHSSAGDSTSYVYDFSGRLLMSTNPPRKYYYDGINTLLVKELYTGSSSSCWRTITANVLRDAPIGQIVTQMNYDYGTLGCTGTPTMNYIAYHYDHIGNVLATTECDGYATPRDAVDMDAFGNVMEGTQEGVRLTTKHYDPSSQLYYFGARWYDPVAGRWIEKDPFFHGNYKASLLNKVGFLAPHVRHSYAMAYNRPVIVYDPNGQFGLLGFGAGAIFGCATSMWASNPFGSSAGDLGKACACGALGGAIGGALGGVGGGGLGGCAGAACSCVLSGGSAGNALGACLVGGATGAVLGGLLPNANSPSGVVFGEGAGAGIGSVLGGLDSPFGSSCGCSQ